MLFGRWNADLRGPRHTECRTVQRCDRHGNVACAAIFRSLQAAIDGGAKPDPRRSRSCGFASSNHEADEAQVNESISAHQAGRGALALGQLRAATSGICDTTASAEVKWLSGFSLAATFEGEFSSVTRSYAGKGVVRYAW